jgi:hypothetical protein
MFTADNDHNHQEMHEDGPIDPIQENVTVDESGLGKAQNVFVRFLVFVLQRNAI